MNKSIFFVRKFPDIIPTSYQAHPCQNYPKFGLSEDFKMGLSVMRIMWMEEHI